MSNCENMDKSDIEQEVADILRVSIAKIEEINAQKESSNFHSNFKEHDGSEEALKDSSSRAASDNDLNDSRSLKKSVSFMLGTYKPTFQMQPEIINSTLSHSNNFNQNFVFGTNTKIKINQKIEADGISARESLELLRKSIESLENRDFSSFTNNFLDSASKLNIQKSEQIKEFKNRISSINVQKKMHLIEISSIEKSLKDVENHLEELLSNRQGESLERNEQQYLIVIQKFCDILSVLFDQITDDAMDENIVAESSCALESLDENPVKHDSSGIEKILNDPIKENEDPLPVKNKCQCFTENKEFNNQDSVINESEMKKAQSVILDSIEDKIVRSKSITSLVSRRISEHKLRKVMNEEDLTKVNSSESLKFIEKSFEQPENVHAKYPVGNNVITVASIPNIINHQLSVDQFNKTVAKSSEHSIENEPYSNAIIQDLDDDGYLDLPKVPSNSLSGISSSDFMVENISFTPGDHKDRSILKNLKDVPFPVVLEENALNCVLEQSQPSTSANIESKKKPKRFCKCRKFLRRLSNTLRRSKGKN